MPAPLVASFARLRKTVAGFSTAQRTIAIIGAAVLILGIVALTSWVSRPSYTPLFSGLSGEDASTIVEQLRTDNVPYELSNGGATILVPEENVYEERLTSAAAGLPSSSTGGYSLLDKMGVTTSEFQQSVTYKRALEGELAKTVAAMKGIQTASVQLAIPEESVFVSEKQDPTASVFVETQTGVTLSNDQVNAIVHLTSASIEGMKTTGVAVIDSSGSVLSAVGTGMTGSADTQKTDYEEGVRSTVQAMLDRIVGAGNSTVAVAASISGESAEVVSETFAAATDVPALSESNSTETFTGSGEKAAGVLGSTDTAATDTGTTTGADGNGNYSSGSSTKNNAVNKITESRTVPAGSVARQTISVAINKDAGTAISQPEIVGLVTAAAGVQISRGDAVAVEVVAFNTAGAADAKAALEASEGAAAADRVADLIRTGIIALGIVIPVLLGLILFLRRSRQSREVVDVADIEAFDVMSLAANGATGSIGSNAPTRAIHTAPMVDLAAAPLSPMEQRRAEISRLAAQDPEKTADFLRRLMDEGKPA